MGQLSFVDSHVHLDLYSDEQCTQMLDRAAAVGVHDILTVGVGTASSRRAISLARRFKASHGVRAAVGLHPAFLALDRVGDHAARNFAIEQIARLLQAEPGLVVALGEIGLDTIDSGASLDLQVDVFRTQLLLAHAQSLPVVLHVQGVEAVALAQGILAKEGVGVGTVVHYFKDGKDEARRWLDLGCSISVGRPVIRAEEETLRRTIADPAIPLEGLLVETDTYPVAGRRTEPADVVAVVEAVASLKRLPLGVTSQQIRTNYYRLLRLSKRL
jgi:TatD DNase family protein